MSKPGKTTPRLILLSLLLSAGIFVLDLAMPLGVAGGMPYVGVVLISLWSPRRQFTLIVAAVCTALTVLGFLYSPPGGVPWMVLTNRFLAAIVIWVTAVLGLQRKQVEEVLRASVREAEAARAKFQGLLEAAPDPIVGVDRDGRIVLVNTQAEKLFGYTRDELLDQPVERLIPDRFRAAHLKHRADYYAHPRTRHMGAIADLRARHKDGRELPVDISLSPLRIGDGIQVTSIIHDVTERKRAEEALRARERQQAAVAKLGQQALTGVELSLLREEAVALIAHTLQVEYCKVLELLPDGKTLLLQAGVGWKAGCVGCATVGAETDSQAGYTLLSSGPVIVEDLRTETRFSGPPLLRDHRVVSGLSVIIQGRKRPFGVLGAHTVKRRTFTQDDIHFLQAVANLLADAIERKQTESELRESEEKLRQAQKMEAVGRLAGGVAHDFNNLLMVMRGYTELLLDHLRPKNPSRRYAEEIRKAADRATSLTQQLLAFSRKQVMQPKVLDLNAVVAETEKLLRRLIGEDIELVTSLGPELGFVQADPGQLEQVILNLAVNARDAMPQGGQLTLETSNCELGEDFAREHPEVTPGPYVLLAMSDTGSGMDAETQSHIFEPFFTTKEKGKGTGLGLATVYGIVKQSGGYIWVHSETGRGTSFEIYLPQVEEAVEPGERDQLLPKPLPGSETVLLVEDETPVRQLAHEFLESSGYTVLEARSPAEAIQVSNRHQGPIHLMVTDVIMPKMSGRELAQQMGSARPEMKVLFVSGYADNAIAQHGVLDGGTAFLQKPFPLDTLAYKVREVLEAGKER